MIQVPTHQDDMTCIDFYLDDTSQLHPPMPCTMYVEGLERGEFCTFTAAIRDWSPISQG